ETERQANAEAEEQRQARAKAEHASRIQRKAEDHVAFKEAVRDLESDRPIISSPISADEARALLTLSPPTTAWLVDGLLPLHGISTVFGHAGAGKSRLLYDLG